MKHNIKITAILLIMFFVTQLIGLAVISSYSPKKLTVLNETTGEYEEVNVTPQLPYGMQPPEMKPEISLGSIIIAMILAVVIVLLLSKIRAVLFLRLWFFFVVALAIGITLTAGFNFVTNNTLIASIIAVVCSLPLTFYKMFKRNFIVHNLTELLIYPGIAAVFVPILSLFTTIILLLFISLYDMYAVWHSGFMQKMAKFQINHLKFFAGFFIPYLNKKQRQEIKIIRQKMKASKSYAKKMKDKKIKVNLAILGGGDVVFPIITAGVILRLWGLVPALLVSIFATLSLLYLFVFAKKGKFYPAMPFITVGCLVGILLGYLI